MKLVPVALAVVATITGCATSSPQFTMPDGSKAATVKCSIDNSKCYAQASELCGGGKYSVLDSESHAGGLVADWIPGPVTWYSMKISCGGSETKPADFKFRGPEFVMPAPTPTPPSERRSVNTDCTRIGDTWSCTSR